MRYIHRSLALAILIFTTLCANAAFREELYGIQEADGRHLVTWTVESHFDEFTGQSRTTAASSSAITKVTPRGSLGRPASQITVQCQDNSLAVFFDLRRVGLGLDVHPTSMLVQFNQGEWKDLRVNVVHRGPTSLRLTVSNRNTPIVRRLAGATAFSTQLDYYIHDGGRSIKSRIPIAFEHRMTCSSNAIN